MLTVGMYLFDDVEVLDFAGPFEVFSTASRLAALRGEAAPFRVVLIGRHGGAVRARGGLRVEVDTTFDAPLELDVLLVPGGVVTAELNDEKLIDWIARTAQKTQLTASICTGAFLLAAAGLLDDKHATTHWEDIDDLRRSFPKVHVEDGLRFIDLGPIVTSAGISAGLDMSLHLVRRLASPELAIATARQMDYDWADDGDVAGTT
jgi:transcriptional regulator GlxA family with amidase domain